MGTPDSSDSKRVLYLDQIDIETTKKAKLNVKLQKDDNNVEVQQKYGTSRWIPCRSLEVSGASKITIRARSKYTLLGKFVMLAEVTGGEAMEAFWDSDESVSRPVVFDRQPATITLHFRPSHTSETIRTAVENLQTAMKDYKSLMTESAHQGINPATKFGVAIAEMNPFAKLGFGLAKVTFDLLKEQRKYDRNVSDLASGIERLLPFAERALDGILYEEEILDRVVRKLYDLIEDTANFLIGYTKRGPAVRALRSTISLKDHHKIEALEGSLSKLKEDFDRAIDVTLLNVMRRSEESELLKWLEPVEAAAYQEKHSCMEGTRTKVLDDLVAWATKPIDSETIASSSNVFWLYGMPGLGKTSVANSLCGRLRRTGNLGGSFICKHDNPSLRDPEAVLYTLICMLVRVWGPFRKVLTKVLVDDPLANPRSAPGELLLKPLKLLKKHPPHPLVLVIDALEECGKHNTCRPLLNWLVEACSLVHWLKVVVTSRPERDIKSFFDSCNVTRLDLASDDLDHKDIRLFTERRMATIAGERHLPPDWPGEERVNKIVERSDGLFIFVETLYRLMDVPEPEPLLAQVLAGESQGADTTLHHLYSTVITSRIAEPTAAFHSILRAIIAVSVHRPLCDESLAELINLEPRVVRSWVDELSSLLYRDHSNKGGISVRHLSILEFFVGSTCPPEFRVDLNLANAELARCCLKIMASKLKFNICDLETSHLANAEIQNLNSRVEEKIPDVLQYSCMYWDIHLRYEGGLVNVETSRLLDGFFAESQLLYWLEVLSLMGKVPLARFILREMKANYEKFEDRHQALIEDALRMVLAFFTPISTSAAHIYISVLPFMPMESSVWKSARALFPERLNVCKGQMKCWPAPSYVWQGHTGAVLSVAYSPDGRNVVSGSSDCTIRIWDAESGAAVGEPLGGHSGPVYSVAYSPDGRDIVSGSDDNTIRIWDAESGEAVGEPLEGHDGAVNSVAYSPDGQNVVSGSDDTTIRIWDARTGAPVGEPLMGHASVVLSVAYSPDGRNVVSGYGNNATQIWDVQTGAMVGGPLKGRGNGVVWAVAYSPDGQNVASGFDGDTIWIWDAQTGTTVGEPLTRHISWVAGVVYSPDGQNLVSCSDDGTIQIWDAQTRSAKGEPLNGHTDSVRSVACSPDGRKLVSGSVDRTIRIWDVENRAAVGEQITGHTDWVRSVAYSPDDRKVASGSDDNTIRIWDVQTGAAVGEPLRGHSEEVLSVAYSPDGRNVVSGSADHTIRMWNTETGAAVGQPLRGHTGLVWTVTYSPNGRNVVSGSVDHTIRIWDVQSGEAVRCALAERATAVENPLPWHTRAIYSVAYSPDGRNIVSGSQDCTIRIWNAETGAAVGEPLRVHTAPVFSVAYSPDGRHIVSGSSDWTIRILDADTGTTVGRPLIGHTGIVCSVAYSPDGRNIVSGSDDHTVRIWDAQTGVAVGKPLRGHHGVVYCVAYSKDGRNVLSSSDDSTVRIWDARASTHEVGHDILYGPSVGPAVTPRWKAHQLLGLQGADEVDYDDEGGDEEEEEEKEEDQTGSPLRAPLESGPLNFYDDIDDIELVDEDNVEIGDALDLDDPSGERGDLFNSTLNLRAFTGVPIQEQLLSSDGWVRNSDGLLFWVPEDCRHGLTCPAITTIPNTGRQRCVRIDFTHFQYGPSWTNVRGMNPGSRIVEVVPASD